ncbi:multidrug effflux MFS transporter [Brachybacterium hainanense]|uniref:Multidrug effflux MFS transporter n=1 Tax=Brachybacterium hainanense TaxID=1541174 RepID=A0ABV6RGJ0_9MICO
MSITQSSSRTAPIPARPSVREHGARRARLGLVLLLGSLSAFGALTIDMYVPAMPSMAQQLATDASAVQATLTVFVIGLALGQVLAGPLSDAWGRRAPLLIGLGIYVIGSLGCALAPSVEWLIAARLIQSLGAATGTVLARAIARDLHSGTAMTRFLSTLMLVNGLAPVLAPVLGAQLLTWASWRAVFGVLVGIGTLLLLAVIAFLPESLPAHRRRPARTDAVLSGFGRLLADADLRRHVLAAALMFSAVFVYISGSAFVLQDLHGLSALEFGLVFGANGLGIVIAGWVNGRIVGRWASEATLLRGSLLVAAIGGLAVTACAFLRAPLPLLLVALFVTVSMLGPVLADATSLALAEHGDSAGTASSLQGMLQFLLAALAAWITSQLGTGPGIMGAAMTACVLLALLPLLVADLRRRRRCGPGSADARCRRG